MAARGLGDRLALTSARHRTLAMLAPLAMALLVIELQRTANYVTLGFIDDRQALRSPLAHALFQGQIAVFCVAPVMAGVLIDLYGVRRTVAVTMIGWCGLVSLGVSLVMPLPYRLGAPLADEMVPGFILCSALVAIVRALDPGRRGVAAMIVLLLFYAARGRPHLATAIVRSVATGWQETMFLLVAVGAFAATLWLAAFREPKAPAGVHQPLSLPDLAIAAGTVFCGALAFAALDPPSLDALALARGAVAEAMPALLGITVTLGAAYASDRFRHRLGPPPAARAAALLPGFLLAAFAGVFGLLARQPPDALALVVAVAGGLLQIVALLALDRAPRQAPGLFVGAVLTADFAAIQYAGPLARSLVPHHTLLLAAGLVGAAWTALLLRPRPLGRSAEGRQSGDIAREAAADEQHEEGEKSHGGADEGQAGIA